MINNRLLRSMNLRVNMQRINRTIKTGATFGIKDALTSVLTLTLYKDSVLDLTDCTVIVNMLKPDGTKIVHSADILDATKGEIAIGMTEQCLSVLGEVVCEMVIHSGVQILYSPKFTFEVVDNLFDESGIESSNEYPLLSTLIREVQDLEASLEQLTLIVETKEEERNIAEEEREANELNRQNSMVDMEDRVDTVISNTNSKIAEMDVEIQNSIDITTSNTQKINVKVTEVNAKIVEVDNKITEVESVKTSLIANVNIKIEDMETVRDSVINSTNAKLDEANDKILEMSLTEEDLIDNVNTVKESLINEVSDKMAETDDKISQVDARVLEINTIIRDVEQSETDRVQAEVDRENTFNDIVAELEVTQTDIDDIIGMVGGL